MDNLSLSRIFGFSAGVAAITISFVFYNKFEIKPTAAKAPPPLKKNRRRNRHYHNPKAIARSFRTEISSDISKSLHSRAISEVGFG
jgi:hypothetical protein